MNTPQVPKVPEGAKRGFGTSGAKSATPIGGVAPTSGTNTAPEGFGTSPDRFALELRAVPGNWQTPPVLRLRAALKRLLRNYGLRCTSCRPVTPPTDNASTSNL